MSYFFLPLENPSVPFLYHPREFCLGAGFIHSNPADVTAPESEQFLVTLPSGLWIAHSLVLNNPPEPGSLDKYLCVLSLVLSHTFPLSSLTTPSPHPLSHTQPHSSKKHCTESAVSQLRGHRGTGWSARQVLSLLLGRPFGGKALLSQKQALPGLRPPRPHLHDCHALPTVGEWQTGWPLPLDSLAATAVAWPWGPSER